MCQWTVVFAWPSPKTDKKKKKKRKERWPEVKNVHIYYKKKKKKKKTHKKKKKPTIPKYRGMQKKKR